MPRKHTAIRDVPLTPEQQTFAETNHSTLIYCMRALRVPDDHYDVAAFGYLAAVRDWFAKPEIRQYSFYTICLNAVRNQLRSERAKEARRLDNVSLDAPIGDEGEDFSLYDVIADPSTEDEPVYTNITQQYMQFWGVLSVRQKQAINLHAAGYSHEQIARALGVKPTSVSGMLYESRKRVSEAERRRSMMLKIQFERQTQRAVPLDDFAAVEERARRRIAAREACDDVKCDAGDLFAVIASMIPHVSERME